MTSMKTIKIGFSVLLIAIMLVGPFPISCSAFLFLHQPVSQPLHRASIIQHPSVRTILPMTTATKGSCTLRMSIVDQCYSFWNDRRMADAADCFADDFAYDDGQYLGTITSKSELKRWFAITADALPPKAKVVVDHVAICRVTGNIATQWHAERSSGDGSASDSIVPLSRGCSFYTIDGTSGLIKTAFKVSEMIVKPSKQFSNGLVESLGRSNAMGIPFMPSNDRIEGENRKDISRSNPQQQQQSSIIEKYFQAWNSRDMESALDCFVEDCTYQTEDPIFVDTFTGKSALREHLLKNVKALPAACNIILDDLAVDTDVPVTPNANIEAGDSSDENSSTIARNTIGVKWHLEVNGVSIPNLRGCSMYTIDSETGLLRSGFDVTEAPLKMPGALQGVLALPFRLLNR